MSACSAKDPPNKASFMILIVRGDIRLMYPKFRPNIGASVAPGDHQQFTFCPITTLLVDNQFMLMVHLSPIEWSLLRVGTSSACKYFRSQKHTGIQGCYWRESPREDIP